MIRVAGLVVGQGAFSLPPIELEVGSGEYVALQGRTGSGKTTLLEALCGLLPARSGSIHVAGRDVTDVHPADRGVGYVPQDGVLFEHLTVADNLGFALRARGARRRTRRARVAALASELRLEPLLHRRARGLSGGERQRVAVGRALAAEPELLLLDEPLSALDEDTREEMQSLLARLRDARSAAVLHVTHSTAEARALADRILALDARGLSPAATT